MTVPIELVSGQPAGSADSVLSCQRPLRVRGRFAGTVGNRTRSFRCRLLLAAIDWGWAGQWHSARTALFSQSHYWGCASSHHIGNKEIRLPLEMIPSTGRVARRHCWGKDCRANLFEDLTSATRCSIPLTRSQLRAYQTGLERLLIMPCNASSRLSAAGGFQSKLGLVLDISQTLCSFQAAGADSRCRLGFLLSGGFGFADLRLGTWKPHASRSVFSLGSGKLRRF